MDTKLYDLCLIEKVCRGKIEAKNRMLETFTSSTQSAIKEIKTAVATQNYDSMRATAHSIKPVLAMYAVVTLEKPIRFIENYQENGDNFQYLQESIKKTEDVITRITSEFSNILNTI